MHQDGSTREATATAIPMAHVTHLISMKPWTWDRAPVSQKRKLRLRDSVMSSRVTSQNALAPDKYHTTCEKHLLYADHH